MSDYGIIELSMIDKLNKLFSKYVYQGLLYHYTSYDSSLKICSSDQLYLKRVDCLEDADEGTDITEFIKHRSECLYSSGRIGDELRKAIVSYSPNPDHFGLGFSPYTACFNTIRDNNLMWRAYGDNMAGACLILNTNYLSSKIRFVKVIYDDTEKEEFVDGCLESLNGYSGFQDFAYHYAIDEMVGVLRYMFKQPFFKAEDEIRIIYLGQQELEEKDKLFPHIELELESNGSIIVQKGPKCKKSAEEMKNDFGDCVKECIESKIKLRF